MSESWLLPQLLGGSAVLVSTALVFNTVLTFAGALLLALLAAKVVGSPRLAKLILLAPWARVLWDVLRGAAPGAYVLSEHAGSKGELGSFQLGLGASAPAVPFVHARVEMQAGGERYGYSVGDMFGHWLFRHVGAAPLWLALALLAAVSAALLVVRWRHALGWRLRLSRAAAQAIRVEMVRVGGRRVQLITSSLEELGPFTSGVLQPRVWLPASLQGSQRAAVLEHELGHVRDWDVLSFGIAGLLADLFWFVPGARYLERCLHERAEEAADASAVARGIPRAALAESILAHAAAPLPGAPPARMTGGSAARLRRRLLALATSRRQSWVWRGLRCLLALAITLGVFRSVFLGYV